MMTASTPSLAASLLAAWAACGLLALALTARTPNGRRRPSNRPTLLAHVDEAMILDIAQAALQGGTSIPGALLAIHEAVAESESAGLDVAARTLLLGGTWEEAWGQVPARFQSLRDALQPAWEDGAAPSALLRQAAEGIRQGRSRRAREAAARLGAHLVLPLGLCFLPAFVMLGIVPVIASVGLSLFH
ncbi:type II secretion system F family protein [Actinobaculum sp. 313]|uniref:type II secretion system F family protein n=1 Tax=Actinobaculum sp. 313 TaxID=2495645 RepID=UPI000D527C09|nr:type II secretion system F family protein [Actinobaculum sp. 313]AWE41615.1 hypothetical protein DDD63_01255 [Actinobaculum sp. 313]